MKLIIIGPPTHFPIGLDEFYLCYPYSKIILYHPGYANLTWDLEKTISTYGLKVVPEKCPLSPECDLIIEVTDEPNPMESVPKIAPETKKTWRLERGPVDLRTLCHIPLPIVITDSTSPKEYRRQLRLVRLMFDLAMGRRDALYDLNLIDPVVAHNWIKRFAEINQMNVEDPHRFYNFDYVTRFGFHWKQIKKEIISAMNTKKQNREYTTLVLGDEICQGTSPIVDAQTLKNIMAMSDGKPALLPAHLRIRNREEATAWLDEFCKTHQITNSTQWNQLMGSLQ